MASHRVYDHRLKALIVKTKNPDLFPDLNIPLSTAKTWIRNGVREVVTVAGFDADKHDLLEQIAELKRDVAQTKAKTELIHFTFGIFGLQIQYQRLPNAVAKETLLGYIKKSAEILPLKECLEAIGLSTARYHNWLKREVRCLLPDQSSCPKLSPTQLTPGEVAAIKDLATSKDYGHFSIPSLAWFAKRQEKAFVSLSSWYRVIADLGLRRPFHRIYPPQPKVGIRASAPNQIWHLVQTLIRLQNGTRIYLQAVIDNFSRNIIAWAVTTDCGAIRTRALLERAATAASPVFPQHDPPGTDR